MPSALPFSLILIISLLLSTPGLAKPKTSAPAPATSAPPPTTTSPPPSTPTTVISTSFTGSSNDSDLFLHVPALSVDQVELNSSVIDAHVRFTVNLGSLFVVQGSVDVLLKDLSLKASDVKAQLDMSVRLAHVHAMFARLMESLDSNPDLLPNLLRTVSNILSSNVSDTRRIMQRYVDASGNILVRSFDGVTGELLATIIEGPVQSLPELGSFSNTVGLVRVYRDAVSGLLIEVQFDASGNILAVKVIQ